MRLLYRVLKDPSPDLDAVNAQLESIIDDMGALDGPDE